MKTCTVCQTENEDDALYCKRCGTSFLKNNQENSRIKKIKDKKKKPKPKYKTKIKYITKVKNKRVPNRKEKSGFFSKFLIFILIILSIILALLLGVLGYNYYQENNIKVPDVLGYSYEEATALLLNANLNYDQKTVFTDEQDEVGVVLKQSKRAGSKTRENTVITLTVGVLDNRVKVPNVTGMVLNDAINILNKAGISYQVIYQEASEEENLVLKQSIRASKVIENTESITLTVSKGKTESSDSQDENNDSTENNTDNITGDDSSTVALEK